MKININLTNNLQNLSIKGKNIRQISEDYNAILIIDTYTKLFFKILVPFTNIISNPHFLVH